MRTNRLASTGLFVSERGLDALSALPPAYPGWMLANPASCRSKAASPRRVAE